MLWTKIYTENIKHLLQFPRVQVGLFKLRVVFKKLFKINKYSHLRS